MAALTKTRTLLHFRSLDGAGSATFGPDLEDGGRDYHLKVDADVWTDMDQPRTITVTIEPGDLLNP